MKIIYNETNRTVIINNRSYVWEEGFSGWDILNVIEYDFPELLWVDGLEILCFFLNFEKSC